MTGNSHIFLSYRSVEADFALKLAADLKNAGVRLWMDRLDIALGMDWRDAIQQAINSCTAMIAVLSPDYVDSEYCKKELARANTLKRLIIPILLHPVTDKDWPIAIQGIQHEDFTDWLDEHSYSEQLDTLLTRLKMETSGQIGDLPDAETRYLTSLIAELESHTGVLKYIELGALADEASDARLKRQWGNEWAGAFAILRDSPAASLPSNQRGGQKKVELSSIHEAIDLHPRFVLIGNPGSGKTTTLRKLALDAARKRLENPHREPLPLLLYLPSWVEGQTIDAFVNMHWPFESDPVLLLARGDVLCYLDGLNEMGARGSGNAKQLRAWLHGENAPNNVIITCRQGDYDDQLDLDLPTVLAKELDAPKIRQFVQRYLDSEKAESFLARVLPENEWEDTDTRHLFRLAQNTFLLATLIFINDNMPDGELPRNNGSLMWTLARCLWDREKAKGTAGWRPYEEVETAFARLSFNMIDEDQPTYVSVTYAIEEVGDKQLLSAAQSANLIEIYGNEVHFYHQLMQEYFASVELRRIGLENRLQNPRFGFDAAESYVQTFPRKWNNVVVALCGIESDSSAVISQLIEINPYLAAECIASGVKVSEHVRKELVTKLLTVLRTEQDWMEAIACRQALGIIGDPAAVTELVRTLRDPRDVSTAPSRGEVCMHTALALGEIGDSSAVPALLDILSTDDRSWVLYAASEALGKIGDVSIIQELLDRLRSTSKTYLGYERRHYVATTLRFYGQATIPGLLDLLDDADSKVRRTAVSLLGDISDASVVPELLSALRDPDSDVRQSVVRSLRDIGNESVVPGLLKALNDKDLEVRDLAISALGDIQDASAVPKLLKVLTGRNDELRISARYALAGYGDVAVLGLIRALGHRKTDVRMLAVSALGDIGDASAITALLKSLNDKAPAVRTASAYALGQIGNPNAVQALIVRLSDHTKCNADSDWLVSDVAAVALENIGTTESMTAARKYWYTSLSDTDVDIRLRAVKILGNIDNPDILPLLDTLTDEVADVRYYVVESLGKIGNSAAVPRLLDILRNDDTEYVRYAAAETLGLLGDPVAVPALIESFENDLEHIRCKAAVSLGLIGAASAIPVLIDALSSDDMDSRNIRGAASKALGLIGDPAAVSALVKHLSDNWMADLVDELMVEEHAAIALDRIGTPEAIEAVKQKLQLGPSRLHSLLAKERKGNS